ncbi:MAG: branched-subunit amino acid aminotransferase/4-amino-4-deoxychorismate lyase [Flavobacteriales bacterium]|jgi:branched-subunit amino acid aminotransferase/4-amino-4-deoxychorismate lyase
MQYVYSHGEYLLANEASVHVTNRGFHFADGFFETIRIMNGKPLFLEHHFSRILESMKVYKFEREINFSLQKLEKEITVLLSKNQISSGGRLRITFTRKSEGFYLPTSNEMEYVIEAYPLNVNKYNLNERGKKLDLFTEMKKDVNKLAIFKNIDCRLYVMASLFAKENQLDDALIQNYKGAIIEATSSNLFLVSNGVLYTSTLEEGPIAGIMRMQLINLALENDIKVYECTLNPQNLLAADELFLTNSISGIQWVSSYRTKRYYNATSTKLISLLNEHVNSI